MLVGCVPISGHTEDLKNDIYDLSSLVLGKVQGKHNAQNCNWPAPSATFTVKADAWPAAQSISGVGRPQTSSAASPNSVWGKYFHFKRETVFGLGHRLSKHQMTRHARNLGVNSPLPRGYAYDADHL